MATHIKSILESFFSQSKEKIGVYQRLDSVLDKTLDSQTRKQVVIKEVENRKLVLQAHSSSALYNFNLQKEGVLEAVKKEIATINDIVVRVV